MDRKIQINRIYVAVIVGAILAVLISFSPGSFFILILTIGAIFFIYRFSNKSERNFILIIFLSGLGARIAVSLLAMSWSIFSGHILSYANQGYAVYSTPYIFGDSGYYNLRALFTSMYWLDKPMSQYTVEHIVTTPYGFSGFINLLAAFFTIFGYSPISSRFINCFLGALTAILVYYIVKEIFNKKPACLAAILTAFFPSMFLWSITTLKDTSMIFIVCLTLWSAIKFQKSKSIYYLIIIALSIWLQTYIRPSRKTALLFINIGVILPYSFYAFISNLSLKRRAIIFLVIFMIGSSFIFFERGRVKLSVRKMVQRSYSYHRGVISSGGIRYKLFPDDFYTTDKNLSLINFSKMFGKGWFHAMLQPLPWNIQSKSMLFVFPQMLLWYFLLLFAILGMGISLRYRLRESIVLIMYFLIMASVLAVTGGNIGTIFRLRDINTPIILIFSSIGLFNTFNPLNLKLNCKR